ncbi:hypothetical protein HZY62_21670 [Maribacter polysiphoniae]|uniref:Uncharacterized protein n=1 Tax=Maribacter polysiphoniae TaxID=429344 RepID=A0A316DGQ6_9FLAO|nr:hypothetical protein [Maribacter polysiphoniae]MBD1263210.1 hypothetical protein [Maribacter polysiphoniae]PWK17487.1 hypothetical protein LX92_04434 [Maribacter polysiphoniae]
MKKSLTFLFLISCFYVSLAQNRANIWYFGYRAGLDFNSGAPVTLLDGQLFTREGCASMCDNYGGLLFYTDGISVYNKNHMLMPNGTGLLGDSSSTHSAIVVPKPRSAKSVTSEQNKQRYVRSLQPRPASLQLVAYQVRWSA